MTRGTPYDRVPDKVPADPDTIPADGRADLARKGEELGSLGIDVKSATESGPVVSVSLDVAEREGADLIAMASHGRTGLGRVFYGSVAEGILHKADRPLLLIRATD